MLDKRTIGIYSHSLALGEECGRNDRARSTKLLATEVGFGHARLHRDCLLVAEGDSRQRPTSSKQGSKGGGSKPSFVLFLCFLFISLD